MGQLLSAGCLVTIQNHSYETLDVDFCDGLGWSLPWTEGARHGLRCSDHAFNYGLDSQHRLWLRNNLQPEAAESAPSDPLGCDRGARGSVLRTAFVGGHASLLHHNTVDSCSRHQRLDRRADWTRDRIPATANRASEIEDYFVIYRPVQLPTM